MTWVLTKTMKMFAETVFGIAVVWVHAGRVAVLLAVETADPGIAGGQLA